MKRMIAFLSIVLALCMITPVSIAKASTNPLFEYTELTKEEYSSEHWLDIKTKMESLGYTESTHPYILYGVYEGTVADVYYIVMSTTPLLIQPTVSGKYHNTLASDGGKAVCYFKNPGTTVDNYGSSVSLNPTVTHSLWANHTIMLNDDTNRSFFGVVPSTLATIVDKSTRQNSPIIVVISLVPLVIFLVASLVGLRKCLQMLRTLLSKA